MTRATAPTNTALTVQRVRTLAARDAAKTVAVAREGGATARETWHAISDLQPPIQCHWNDVETLIARVVFADIVREARLRRALVEGGQP